jgi:hypothetical protein
MRGRAGRRAVAHLSRPPGEYRRVTGIVEHVLGQIPDQGRDILSTSCGDTFFSPRGAHATASSQITATTPGPSAKITSVLTICFL